MEHWHASSDGELLEIKSSVPLYIYIKGLLSEEDTIRGIAEGYRVVDGTLSELCDINAKVAMKMGREQVSLTWVSTI